MHKRHISLYGVTQEEAVFCSVLLHTKSRKSGERIYVEYCSEPFSELMSDKTRPAKTGPFETAPMSSTQAAPVDMALSSVSPRREQITIGTARCPYTFSICKIISITSNGHYIIVQVIGAHFRIRSPFKAVEEQLNAMHDSRFLKCNRGILLNMDYIDREEDGLFVMRDGTRYTIHSRHIKEIKDTFACWHQKRLSTIDSNAQ